ncbi:MAG: polyketide cyclase [Actinomycetia bacterium]|nr:polyketide cyclase [Actinomycetes bacterium]
MGPSERSSFGGWIWWYDFDEPGPSRTVVTLTSDWSAVPSPVREFIQFPPFGRDHLGIVRRQTVHSVEDPS